MNVMAQVMVYKLITWFPIHVQSFEKEGISWENGIKTVYVINNCWTPIFPPASLLHPNMGLFLELSFHYL